MASRKKKPAPRARPRSSPRKKPHSIPIRPVFGRGKKPEKKIGATTAIRPRAGESDPILHIRISRFNPAMDFVSRTHEYSVHSRKGESILDLLTRIKHTQDGSLTFRASCGYGGCGTCGVRVNGKPVLGCVTQVKDHVDSHHGLRIDPLNEENTLKDLVVDEKPFFDQLTEVKPFLVPRAGDAKRHHRMGPNDVEALEKSHQCVLCGLCNANASADQKPELGPAAFVKGYRYLHDIRDGDPARISALNERLPVHYSLEKANLCPRDITPGDKIRSIREKADKPRPGSSRKQGMRP